MAIYSEINETMVVYKYVSLDTIFVRHLSNWNEKVTVKNIDCDRFQYLSLKEQ